MSSVAKENGYEIPSTEELGFDPLELRKKIFR